MSGEPATCSATLPDGAVCGKPIHPEMPGDTCPSCRGRHASKVRRERRHREVGDRSLRNIGDCLSRLEYALRLASNAGKDKLARASTITKIVEAAHRILTSDTERTAETIEKLLKDHPDLARHLKAVK